MGRVKDLFIADRESQQEESRPQCPFYLLPDFRYVPRRRTGLLLNLPSSAEKQADKRVIV